MKTYLKYALPIAIVGGAAAIFCLAQPNVPVTPPAVAAPPAIAVTPPPATAVVAPDYYYWDGVEYIGVVGGQYYYLGPDNTWVVADPVRVHRFQAWERNNLNWRDHGTRNVRYHTMARPVQPQPMHAAPTHVNPPATPSHVAPQQHNNGPPQ